MLPDFERKLLRILHNFLLQRKRMPRLKELMKFTGRQEEGIYRALERLAEERYIRWDRSMPLLSLVILEAWERNAVSLPKFGDALKHWPD